jgi:O-antigen/teichoic acid export membrane protein
MRAVVRWRRVRIVVGWKRVSALGLREQTIRGGSARVGAQALNFLLRIGSVMVLSRLLNPRDFGLVNMVTAFTGILALFRDCGLSAASVQRNDITEEQTSTLFWVNVAMGAILTILAMVFAPVVGRFYHEPRLWTVTAVVAIAFAINGFGVQHSALLQRQMRFATLASIEIFSLLIGTTIAIGLAKLGAGYWALVAMAVIGPFVTTVGVWRATGWFPGPPERGVGLRSMLRFGGTMTMSSLVLYIAYNFVNVLLGRYWGAAPTGIYSRAYQLVRIPTDNLNSSVGEVAFAALARVQNEPERLRRYFLKGYSVVLALTVPITIACALFANDLVSVLLGPKWEDAGAILRLLAPTILVFAIVSPLGWLLSALGLVGRGLKIALVFAPFMIVGCLLGLPYGLEGVAFAYSLVMTAWMVPTIVWAVHGTAISVWDVLKAPIRPLISSAVAAALALGVDYFYGPILSPLSRLLVEGTVLATSYLVMLLFATGQKSFYLDLWRGSKGPAPGEEKSLASA